MSRFYVLVKITLVASHRDIIDALRQDDYIQAIPGYQFRDSLQFMHRKMRE